MDLWGWQTWNPTFDINLINCWYAGTFMANLMSLALIIAEIFIQTSGQTDGHDSINSLWALQHLLLHVTFICTSQYTLACPVFEGYKKISNILRAGGLMKCKQQNIFLFQSLFFFFNQTKQCQSERREREREGKRQPGSRKCVNRNAKYRRHASCVSGMQIRAATRQRQFEVHSKLEEWLLSAFNLQALFGIFSLSRPFSCSVYRIVLSAK